MFFVCGDPIQFIVLSMGNHGLVSLKMLVLKGEKVMLLLIAYQERETLGMK